MTRENQKVALVTGGAGFIGSNLCERLVEDGVRVICLDNFRTGSRENLRSLDGNPAFELIEHDVIDEVPQSLRSAGLTHIYSLACPASPPHYQSDPEHTLLTSVLGTRNMLRLAEETGARMLLSSTSEVYGDPDVHPQNEDYRGSVSCTGPRACYDEGKRAAETLSFDFLRAGRARVRVARIFNTYGPKMRRDDGRIMSNVICQALSGEDITVYGDGLQTRSLCFVDDLVDALILLIDSDVAAGMPVNLGNPNELAIKQLVDLIVEMTGSDSKVVHLPLPVDDPRRRNPDIRRAQELLGWSPQVDLERGIEATISWFNDERSRAASPIGQGRSAIAAE